MLIFGGRCLARAAALALTTGLLSVLGVAAPTPASAAILCRETFAGTPAGIQAKKDQEAPFAGLSTITVPVARTAASARVTIDIAHPQASSLQLFVTPPNYTGFFDPNTKLFQSTSGTMNGIYTFDDAAATSIDGANKAPGLYRPSTPLSQLAGRATQGDWLLWVNNFPAAPAGKLRAVSLTLTYADCPDANGDGLHDDADGDGVLLPPDNCPDVANPDQLDSDVDGIGNACDPTPFLPPPPPVGQPGPRDVSLTYVKKIHRFQGSVSSPVASCEKRVEVELWKRRRGDDRRVSAATTNPRGKFRTTKVRKLGRYYVTVASAFVDLGAVECAAEVSRAVKVRR